MKLFSNRGGAIALALAAATFSIGQTQTANRLSPVRVERQVVSSPIDTSDFLVKIDESYNYQPLRPENPAEEPDRFFKRNNLPVGKLLGTPRTMQEAPEYADVVAG